MTRGRQWTLILGTVMTITFGIALAIKIRPEIDLVSPGTGLPAFQAVNLRTQAPATPSDYRGKVVLLNIWATWCDPCRLEMPAMEKLSERLQGTDFRVVAVSVDKDGPDVVMQFVKALGLRFDILQDQSGEIQKTLQTTGVPESFVVDRNGVIIKKVIGAEEWDAPVNETLIRTLLNAH
ncbi:MAG TPA: TlpA disulfide reductase family protein [Gemmatimonadales bacterium]|nr:TlpA disulfide reductase family protein [Gemmatimonadales bacterium]